MAVKPVKVISIIGMMSELDKVVKLCGDSRMFHPDDAMSFYSNKQGFSPLSEKNPYSVSIQNLKSASELAGFELTYKKPKGFNKSDDELLKYAGDFCDKIDKLSNGKLQYKSRLEEINRTIAQVKHFTGSNLNFTEINKCRFINPTFGRLPKESYEKLNNYSENPYVLFFPCSNDDTHYWGAYFSPPDKKSETDRIFSSLYFESLEIPPIAGRPEDIIKALEDEKEEIAVKIKKSGEELKNFLDRELDTCNMYYSKLMELDSYHEIKRYVYKYNKSFILVGWIPADGEDLFTSQLDGIKSIDYSLSDGRDEIKHSPPIIMKNPPFFRLYEFYVKMYGLPCYNEIDPTTVVALTYTLFFGIMFGDVGQGLVVAIVGFLMWKLKKMEVGRILVPCGISGMIFGSIYGSVFGFEEAMNPVYKALLGIDGKLVDVMNPDTISMIIYGSVALGFITVAIIMLINIVSSIKRRDLESALFGPNGVSGFVFYVSLVVGLVLQMFMGIEVMTPVYLICLIILPLLLIYMREPLGRLVSGKKKWQPEKWGEYFVQSFFELFEMCLGYLTNTMSFLRVGAYILVHAGMMTVVFTLAEMMGGVGFYIVLVLGNALVMALEALLVAIQVLRLDYYEIFSRFYVGEGRPFNPVIAGKHRA